MIFDQDASWGPLADKVMKASIDAACGAALHLADDGKVAKPLIGVLGRYDCGKATIGRYINLQERSEVDIAYAAVVESLLDAGWKKTAEGKKRKPTQEVWEHPKLRLASLDVELYARLICILGYPSREQ
jgi:hypothetical protein